MGGAPTWFGRPDRRLFGWVHRPVDGRARGTVVLCPPIGHEEANALPALQALADMLAADGIAALRFAYGGTGDSAGRWDDPDRLEDWVTSVDEALLFARRAHGGPLVLVGMRMGALLAVEALARGAKVDGLVLWDPCSSGREFLRVERTLLAAGYGAAQAGDGSVSGPAFTYAADTVAEISSLTLVPPEPGSTRAVLVLARPDSRVGTLRAAFDDIGADWAEVGGQADLLDVPPDMVVVPGETLRRVHRWVDGLVDGPVGSVRFEPEETAIVVRPNSYDHSASSASSASAHRSDSSQRSDRSDRGRSDHPTDADDGVVTEHPVWLGPFGLFGMVTDPPEHRRVGPTVAFLTAGALDHTGPGRLWVELARRLAVAGVRSVRVDIDGIGETYGRPGHARQVPKPPEAIDDTVDAATGLGGTGGCGGVILVGLSSGGYHAIEAGLRLQLAGVAAVNPGLTSWVPEMDRGSIDPRRRAFRPMPPALRRLSVEHKRLARWVWHAVLQLRVGRSASAPVAGLSRRGTPVLLVTSVEDARQFEPSPYWWAVRRVLHRRGLLRVEIVPGGDHSLYTPEGRRDAEPVLVSWLLAQAGAGSLPLATGAGPDRVRVPSGSDAAV